MQIWDSSFVELVIIRVFGSVICTLLKKSFCEFRNSYHFSIEIDRKKRRFEKSIFQKNLSDHPQIFTEDVQINVREGMLKLVAVDVDGNGYLLPQPSSEWEITLSGAEKVKIKRI